MSTVDRLVRLREERIAREKARIEKLRELNLKKYNKNDASNIPTQKIMKSSSVTHIKTNIPVKNNNGATMRPITAPIPKTNVLETKTSNEPKEGKVNYLQKNISALKNVEGSKIERKNDPKVADKIDQKPVTVDKKPVTIGKKPVSIDKKPVTIDKKPAIDRKPTLTNKINNDKLFDRKPVSKTDKILAEIKPFKKIDPKLTRKSFAAIPKPCTTIPVTRKSMIPKTDSSKETVFERLYKPRTATKKPLDNIEKLQTDPHYLKKVIKNSGLILKRHTCFDTKDIKEPVRRSISAVHFKRINKSEIGNCIHKCSSIGDINHLNLDEGTKEESVFSAVKSERKKVTFLTPMSHCNTPRPEDLQKRLQSWLQKRGKSMDSFHHLQCFGMHHLPRKFELTPQSKPYDEENKENIAVDSDSDDGSYTDNMQKDALSQGDSVDIDKWRQNIANESMRTEFNDTADLNETTVTSADTFVNVDELLNGALNDLTELLREGYEWEQSARYLRAIKCHFPEAPRTAAYWECRAALEERRGNLHASVQCWEEALVKGIERNVVEANLDTLLNKFMQLKISPNSAVSKRPDAKMVDVKNVFKSTIIRFAVQQAKLRQSETPVVTVTPVRRSGRISLYHTPRGNINSNQNGNTNSNINGKINTDGNTNITRQSLQICESVKDVYKLAPQHIFTPNKNLVKTP